MSTVQIVPSEYLSRARPSRLTPDKFSYGVRERGRITRILGNTLTAIMLAALLAVPTGATAYAMTSLDSFESVVVMKNQEVPAYLP